MATGTAGQEMRVANSLTTQALTLNAISTNPTANALVASNGLAGLFDPESGNDYVQWQLRDVDAQHFMEYLVGCALEATQSIPWKDPLTGTEEQWKGKAGLCPKWELGPPTEECKRRVSACILARNNAFGRRVELSLRGEDPSDVTRFALENKTAAVDYDPDLEQHVPSFQACAEPQSGVHRDCGWQVGRIGRCAPGQTVRLGMGGRAPDQCTTGAVLGSTEEGQSVLRVCEGLIGCDEGNARQLARSEGSCGTTEPAVTFTCPASGDFNVMTAPYDSTQSHSGGVDVETGTPAGTAYGLSEGDVFHYREGAFYGTLFDASALAATVYVDRAGGVKGKGQLVQGTVYRKMFSCYAPEWMHGAAYATHRVCALPGSGANCAATVTGACINPQDRSFPASVCQVEDGPLVSGDGDFERCMDPGKGEWREPITVYLHTPCDLVPDATLSELCVRKPRGK
jgi:hypothetical protein